MKQKSHADFTQQDVHEQPASSQQSEEESGYKGSKSKNHKIRSEVSSSAITDYEKQRQKRIQENKAKLQALGLPTLAASLPSTQPNNKTSKKPTSHHSKKIKQDDNDYLPSTEEEDDDDEKRSDSSSDDDEEYNQQKLATPKKGNPTKRRPPPKPKGKKMKSLSSLTVNKASKERASLSRNDELDKKIASLQDDLDDDAALQQALALSMGVSMEDAAAIAEASRQDTGVEKANEVDNSDLGGKGKAKAEVGKAPRGKRQRKQTKNMNNIQLTEDEVVAYFFYFDEAGKGKITLRDLERVSLANDFMWTKQELMEMINAFDKDQDGQLILEDFQAIAARCNMIGGT